MIDPDSKKRINPKPDFYIKIGCNEYGISTKMGSGNSVHQESVDSFITWLKRSKKIFVKDSSVFDDIKFFIWADGTLDGTAPIERNPDGIVKGRFTTKQFKSMYHSKWEKINNFLIYNKEEIIKRTLFFGKTNKEVHYIYHGTPTYGMWINQKQLLSLNLNQPLTGSTFNIGRMSFQIYNADIKGTIAGSKKRGQIQLKYGNLSNDLKTLTLMNSDNIGSYEGDLEEFDFCRMMNKNKNHTFWKFLYNKLNLDTQKNYYIVKVIGQKYSKNAQKKVMCKTDNYLIETNTSIDKKLLLKLDYQLTEENLSEIKNYIIVPNSGISIKLDKSKNFTITKMSLNSFKVAFSEYINDIDHYVAALVFYCDKKQVYKNYEIAQNININIKKFISFFNEKYDINIEDITDFKTLNQLNILVKNTIKNIIDTNISLKKAIFRGLGWFEDPYYINFIYSNGKLSDEVFLPYHIDNGSGRSKGIYSIIIKPNK